MIIAAAEDKKERQRYERRLSEAIAHIGAACGSSQFLGDIATAKAVRLLWADVKCRDVACNVSTVIRFEV